MPESLEHIEREMPKDSGLLAAGLSLLGTGVGVGVAMVVQKRRGFMAWLVPGALIAFGIALLTTAGAGRYGARVDAAEQDVRDRLDQLDPFARVKILKDLASEQVPSWLKQSEQGAPT